MIFQKNTVFHMFSYKSLASDALVLVITVIADKSPWNCVTYVMYNLFNHIFPIANNIKIYIYIY